MVVEVGAPTVRTRAPGDCCEVGYLHYRGQPSPINAVHGGVAVFFGEQERRKSSNCVNTGGAKKGSQVRLSQISGCRGCSRAGCVSISDGRTDERGEARLRDGYTSGRLHGLGCGARGTAAASTREDGLSSARAWAQRARRALWGRGVFVGCALR